MNKIKINEERLWTRLMELSQIGAEATGGVTRFSYTREDKLAKQLVKSYMLEAGMSVREDEVGNLIGRVAGQNEALPIVMTGSHIDTVKQGGKFDGALGVLSAIESIQTLKEQGIAPIHPIELIAFADEEGSRFGFGMIGSRAIAGTLTEDHLKQVDEQGITIFEAMKAANLQPELLKQCAKYSNQIKGYIELHIEQGKVLEMKNEPVGIVTGIAGPLWMQFTLTGQAGHAGATPMNMRRDPMQAATKIINYIFEQASTYENAVATVGKFSVKPGGVNIIPSDVVFTLDLRDIDIDSRNALEKNIRAYAQEVCEAANINIYIEDLQRVKPVPSSEYIMQEIEEAGKRLGYDQLPKLVSGAGHDGMQFYDLCPVGMIFVRSKDGISHNPLEWTTKEDCAIATQLLYETITKLAN